MFPRTRTAVRLALAVSLSLAPAPTLAAPTPAPSERDLAYERAVRAEEAGDHAAAADHYERAFRLTTAAETGPRLLFLRSSVSARQRAFAGTSDAKAHLCPARALLRDFLDAAADTPGSRPDITLAERDSMARIEAQLVTARVDCTAAVPTPPDAVPDAPRTDPRPATGPSPVRDPSPAAEPPAAPVGPEPPPSTRPSPVTRNLRIAGGGVLGVAVAGFALMTAGIVLAADARRDGFTICHTGKEACDNFTNQEVRDRGERANALIPAGATLGGIGLVTGIVLLAVSKRAGRPRVAITPAPTGLTLSGRF